MHFNVTNSDSDEVMSKFFENLEAEKDKLGIVDVQLAMSSLEDVFLTVATASELEDAKNNNKTTTVTLKSGEPVGVLLGFEGTYDVTSIHRIPIFQSNDLQQQISYLES
jgi:hypothetical protein